jgi:hypothetical protein
VLTALIEDSTTDTTPLATVLRRVKVLASRSGSPDLDAWAAKELEGYAREEALPAFRGPFPTIVYGDFSGPYGSRQTRVQLPKTAFPEDLRSDALFDVRFLQSVAELEAIAEASRSGAGDGTLSMPWDPVLVGAVNRRITEGTMELLPMMGVETIYRSVTPAQVRSVLDAIRTRVLDFALELEKAEALTPVTEDRPLAAAVVTYTFNTVVLDGGSASVGVDPVIMQALARPTAGLDDLLSRLRAIGVDEGLVLELEAASEDEPDSAEAAKGWLARLADRGGQIGASVTTSVVTQLVLRHFGLA